LGSKEESPLHDFAHVAIDFLLAAAFGRHRGALGRRLGIGFWPQPVQMFLDRGEAWLQALNRCGNRNREGIDLLAQWLGFSSSQIAAFEALFYLGQGSL